ncbi:MAG: hypothetical protein KDI36_12660 [Pseudomonadales bacterium]|nr:hypothetical protein [Pseudomonadales bacterium]
MSEPQALAYPDIEIYLKRVPVEDILSWLDGLIGICESTQRGEKTEVILTDNVPCTIFENAVKGGYTSVWFRENRSPWLTDEACAEVAFAHFGVEVRCSTGSWEGEDEQGWIRFTKDGRSVVNWLA